MAFLLAVAGGVAAAAVTTASRAPAGLSSGGNAPIVDAATEDTVGTGVSDDPEPATAEPAPADVAPAKWRPTRGEVYPNAKRLAARVVEALIRYPRGVTPDAIAEGVASRFDIEATRIIDAARQLVQPDAASAGVVVYPQLGGVRPESASVMVVVDQSLDAAGRQWVERRTVDVRLVLRDGRWQLDKLGSGGGTGIRPEANPSPSALAVLDNAAIELTDSARWDIHAGDVDERLLALMAAIAERHTIAVTTIATGHPRNVFGTDIMSNHTKGRAVDIFEVDGRLVVEQRNDRSAAYALAKWLFGQGVPELGAPWAFDGAGGRSFTDVVHADHIHVAA